MKVFIITEGGSGIGFGHVARCDSLYQAFKEKEILPEFIINGDESVKSLLNHNNYKLFNWLEKNQELFNVIKGSDVVIIDSYLADFELYKKISELVKLTVYIDDNNRIDYPKGIVVNGCIYALGLDYNSNPEVTYLLGSQYALLRKEFWDILEKEIKKDIENIMITFGGDDIRNMTQRILRFLNEEYPKLIKKVVIGKGFQNIKEIENLKDKKTDLIYYPDAGGMKTIMLGSDIAISSGGQTLHELARAGVPAIGICVFDNQIFNLEEWRRVGFIEYIGWYNNERLLSKLKDAIDKLGPYKDRAKLSNAGKVMMKGNGARNVVRNLI